MENKTRTVLIADNDHQMRDMIKLSLKKINVTSIEAKDGRSALRAIMVNKPDMVLLDNKIPIMNGYAVIKEINDKYPKLKDIPIAVLAGDAKQTDVLKFSKMGVIGYIAKPFRLESLVDLVKKNLNITDELLEKEKHDRYTKMITEE